MKRILCGILCCILLMGLVGCNADNEAYVPTGDGLTWDDDYTGPTGPSRRDEEDQSLALAYYPYSSMNPFQATDFTNRALFSLIYQSLFVTGKDYHAEPILCQAYYVSEDMKSYTFILEPATFADGSKLTSEDVLASLQAAANSDYYGGRFQNVYGMYILPDGGIQIQMKTPHEDLPILLDIPIVKANETHMNSPQGTGPYVLEYNEMGSCLRRRTNWWCDPEMAITAPTISLMNAASATQIRDEFEFGDLSLVCADPGSDKYVDYRCDYELWDCESGVFVYLIGNPSSPVFSNAWVRAALTYAVDREALVKTHYRGFARSASLPASPLSPYYNLTLAEKYRFDNQKFMDALSGTGLAGSQVTLLVNQDDSLRLRVARDIAQMLTNCGLYVVMKELPSSEYHQALWAGNYDLYLGQTKLSPNMDLSAFFAYNGALSAGGISDISALTLCQQALENHGNYYTLHKTIMDNGFLCPVLFRSYAVYATRGLLTGLTPTRDNVFYYSLGKTMEDVLIA